MSNGPEREWNEEEPEIKKERESSSIIRAANDSHFCERAKMIFSRDDHSREETIVSLSIFSHSKVKLESWRLKVSD
jgi:hypothetical protein